jgi:hypothetical protein
LSDDSDSDKLQTMYQAATDPAAKTRGDGRKAEQQQDRRQRESGPGRESPQPPSSQKTNREYHLAARRPWKELTESDQIGEGFVIEPASPFDEFPAKVSQMGNGTAEARQPQFERSRKNLRGGSRPSRVRGGEPSFNHCRFSKLRRSARLHEDPGYPLYSGGDSIEFQLWSDLVSRCIARSRFRLRSPKDIERRIACIATLHLALRFGLPAYSQLVQKHVPQSF